MDRAERTKKTEEHDFEHIVEMSQEFDAIDEETIDSNKGLGEYWHLRIMLAIAQQLSVISASLKRDRE